MVYAMETYIGYEIIGSSILIKRRHRGHTTLRFNFANCDAIFERQTEKRMQRTLSNWVNEKWARSDILFARKTHLIFYQQHARRLPRSCFFFFNINQVSLIEIVVRLLPSNFYPFWHATESTVKNIVNNLWRFFNNLFKILMSHSLIVRKWL